MKDRRLPEGAEAADQSEQIPAQHSQPVTSTAEVPGGNRAVGQLLAGPAGSQSAPVLFGIDQTTRQIYVSVSVPGHPVADIATYLYGNADRATDIQAANGIADVASPGAILRLPSGELAAQAQATVNRALGDGTILRTKGVPPGESASGPLLVYRFSAAGQSFELTEGQLRGMAQGQANWLLRRAKRVFDYAETGRDVHKGHLDDTNSAVRWVSDFLADQDELPVSVWNDALTRSSAIIAALETFDAMAAGRVTDAVNAVAAQAAPLADAAEALDRAERAWHQYIEGTIGGAEVAAHRLEIVRDTAFVTVAGMAGALAAPVVFAAAGTGLATVGVTGTAATVLSGTAAVGTGALAGGAVNTVLNVVAPSALDNRPAGERLWSSFERGALAGGLGAIGGLLAPGVNGAVSQRMFGAAPQALSSFGQRAAVNVVGGVALSAPLGAVGSAIGNVADLINGKIDATEYLSRIGWDTLKGAAAGVILGVLSTPLRNPNGGALATRSAPAAEPDVVYQPPQVDPKTGVVTQMAFHRPSGQYLQATYDPATGTGQIVNLSTGELVGVYANGTVSPAPAARLTAGSAEPPAGGVGNETPGGVGETATGETATGGGETPAPQRFPALPAGETAPAVEGGPVAVPAVDAGAPTPAALARLNAALAEHGVAGEPMFAGLDGQSVGKVTKALTSWPRGIPPSLRLRMVGWARDGAGGNAREFANRVEYARARWQEVYDQNLEALAGSVPQAKLVVAAREATARTMNSDAGIDAELTEVLRADLEIIAASPRSGILPPEVTPAKVPEAVRDLEALPWETPTAEAYHARKHLDELTPEEQAAGDPVTAFARSLRETVQSGKLVTDAGAGTSRMLIYHREVGPGHIMEAIIYVRVDGSAVVATYGAAKAKTK